MSGTPQRRQNTPSTASLGDAQVAPERELEATGDRVTSIAAITGLPSTHAGRAHRTVAVERDAIPAAPGSDIALRSAPAQNVPRHR